MPHGVLATALCLVFSATLSAITITPMTLPGGIVGMAYSVQIQATGAMGPAHWGSTPDPLAPGLSISSSGLISGIPTTPGKFNFTVQVSDNSAMGDTRDFSVTIAPCVPTLVPTSPILPGADINIKYSITFSATGCSGSYMFSAQAVDPFNPGILPPGLQLSPSGVLSGIPGQVSPVANPFTFEISANGPSMSSAQVEYMLTVNPLPTVTTASPLPAAPVGVLYSQQIAAIGGVPGTSGYVFSMNNNPPGLSLTPGGLLSGTPPQTGIFQFNIGVTDSLGGQTTSPFQISVVSANPEVQVSPASLTFNADVQGNPPDTQTIAVVPTSGTKPPVDFRVQISGGLAAAASAPSWVSVNPTSATAPAGLTVSVDQGTMLAGVYKADIRVLDIDGLPTDVPVTLNVNNTAQKITVSPSMLRFRARAAAPGILTQDLLISNIGGSTLGFGTSVVGGSSWITGITPGSGQTTRNALVFVEVQVSTHGLSVGSYQDIIQVESPSGVAVIPITLFVASDGPILAVNTPGVLFVARQNDGSSAKRNIEILNIGNPNSVVNWVATLLSGSDWLDLVSSSGTATPSSPGTLSLAPFQNATQLGIGPHYALVKIADSKSLNAPQYVTAVLDLEPESASPAPDAAPGGLFFSAINGATAPSPQQVLVNVSSSASLPFQVATTTTDQGSWLNAAPASGNANGQTPGILAISVDPTGLAAGIYTGNVNISVSGQLQSVNITFVVLPNTVSNSISRLKPEVLGCSPSKLAITETSLANNFAVPAGWPDSLIVQLDDDCGSLVTNGNVIATFSNGDSPLALTGDSLGNYSATWQPGAVTSEMVVTLNASAGALKPATATLSGGIAQNATPPPTLAPGGTLNNLNPVLGGSLAPGLIAQVYGSGLAASPVSTKVLPVPETFDHTFAQVGAYQAPLYFLSSGQFNVQIPSELIASQQIPILLSVNGALTLPDTLDIVPTAPGVLSHLDGPTPPSTQNGAHIIAQHSDYTLVSSTSPAKPSEYLMMYLVGLGATNPSVPSGYPAPAPPAALAKVTHTPIVMVDNQVSNVVFAGLTPGFAGLYQINFQVPPGAHSGDVDVTVTQNGVAANPTKLPVSQ